MLTYIHSSISILAYLGKLSRIHNLSQIFPVWQPTALKIFQHCFWDLLFPEIMYKFTSGLSDLIYIILLFSLTSNLNIHVVLLNHSSNSFFRCDDVFLLPICSFILYIYLPWLYFVLFGTYSCLILYKRLYGW